jgi:regulator of protease activity HflC (stomatin/prohibitin superfamily)
MQDNPINFGDLQKNKNFKTVLVIIGLFAGLWVFSQMVGIVNIPQDRVGVIFSEIGSAPPDGRFIVENGQKGTYRQILKPGMHFLGPKKFFMSVTLMPVQKIPTGKIGIITALDGRPLPDGEIIAEDDEIIKEQTPDKQFKETFKIGQKGIRKSVLMPGNHYINPKYLSIKTHDMISIPDKKYGMLTRKVGPVPPDNRKLVPLKETTINNITAEFKGMIQEVLKPGDYPLNPYIYDVKVHDAINVPAGKVGIRVRKIGDPPPKGTVLVARDSLYRGIIEELDHPGLYFINLNEYDYQLADAVMIDEGFVGVEIAKIGKESDSDDLLVEKGYMGIQQKPLKPGLYYINPFATKIIKVDTRQQKYEMSKDNTTGDTDISDDIRFRSDDGFNISVDLTVVYQIPPIDAPYVVATLGGDIAQAITKIIRPTARSFARLEGSLLKAEQFIRGETRTKFQMALEKKLIDETKLSRIKIVSALLRNYDIPEELLTPIKDKEIAEKQKQKYMAEQEREKELAKLAMEKALVEQLAKKTMAETEKIQNTIKADQEKEIALIQMNTQKEEAIISKEKTEIEASARLRVAELEKAIALQYKEKKLLEAEADATYKSKVMAADGALTEKMKTYLEATRIMADAIKNYKGNWTPSIIMGNSGQASGSASAAGISNADSFMQLLTVKAAKDLALDLKADLPQK